MRELKESEKEEMRRRCAGLERDDALVEGGRYLASLYIIHWTSEDVAQVLFGKTKTTKTTKKHKR